MIDSKKATTFFLALLLDVNSQALDLETEKKLKELLDNQSGNQVVLGKSSEPGTVSYTHLTLPTNREV